MKKEIWRKTLALILALCVFCVSLIALAEDESEYTEPEPAESTEYAEPEPEPEDPEELEPAAEPEGEDQPEGQADPGPDTRPETDDPAAGSADASAETEDEEAIAREAWMSVDGVRLEGELDMLIRAASAGAELFIMTPEVIHIDAVDVEKLSQITLAPDDEVFLDGGWAVEIALEDPERKETPVLLTFSEEQMAWYAGYAAEVWIYVVDTTAPEGVEERAAIDEGVVLTVVVSDTYDPEAWMHFAPTFALSGKPDGWEYYCSEKPSTPLSGNAWTAQRDGIYEVFFWCENEAEGLISERTQIFPIRLDTNPPTVVIEQDEDDPRTLTITAIDDRSGVYPQYLIGDYDSEEPLAFFSNEYGEKESTVRLTDRDVLKAGALIVFDQAWNRWTLDEDIDLTRGGDDPGRPDIVTITVTPSGNYEKGVWMKEQPSFTLDGIPTEVDGWRYGYIDSRTQRPELMDGNVYQTTDEGEYDLTFFIRDEEGEDVCFSDAWPVKVGGGAEEEITITVTPSANYTKDTWMKEQPSFTLSGIPTNADGWRYGYIDPKTQRMEPMDGDVYQTIEEGEYNLIFFIQDGDGEYICFSDSWPVKVGGDVEEDIKITVKPSSNYKKDSWVNEAPMFTLSGIPEGREDLTYKYIINGGPKYIDSGNVYEPIDDGIYNIWFVICDETNKPIAYSDEYTIMLDQIEPLVEIEISETSSYMMTITAEDDLSGPASISFDGGETWEDVGGGTYIYKGTEEQTFTPGSIIITDNAGNMWINDKKIHLTKVEDEERIKITVKPSGNYDSKNWVNEAPMFKLSGIPEGREDLTYKYVISGGPRDIDSGNTYEPIDDGEYSIWFVICDEANHPIAYSDEYTIMLDQIEPSVAIEMSDDESFKMTITVEDDLSGPASISFDGGETWEDIGSGTYTYEGTEEQTFAAGSIIITDNAGNMWTNDEEIVLSEATAEEGGGMGGGGSEQDDANKRTVKHSSGTGRDADEYETLDMNIEEEAAHDLIIDGVKLNLKLDLVCSEDATLPEGYKATFTSDMAHWEAEKAPQGAFPSAAEEGEGNRTSRDDNTLILTAEEPEGRGSQYQYIWRFTGDVPRKLYNSGVDYLVLRVGDDVVSLPTAGFTGGTAYVQLKMDGVASRMFEYAVTMAYDETAQAPRDATRQNTTEDMDLTVAVEVQQQRYELEADAGEMFYYDLYAGPAEMMRSPYGVYNREHAGGQNG